MITGIIVWIIIGLIAGALGKLIMPGDDPGDHSYHSHRDRRCLCRGFITQNLLGMGGGGFIWTIIVATLGAIILLALYRLVANRLT